MSVTGECFCGSVGYTVRGSLKDPLACHCSRCRKAFSAPASHYARVNPDEFRWTRGDELLSTYVGKNGFGLCFCKVCGSTLCGTVDGDIHGVTLGCLNQDPKIDELHHVFVDSRAAWDIIPQDVAQFPEGRSKADRRE